MDDTNLLSLIKPWLDTNYQITTKSAKVAFRKIFQELSKPSDQSVTKDTWASGTRQSTTCSTFRSTYKALGPCWSKYVLSHPSRVTKHLDKFEYQHHPTSTCAPPRSACSTLFILIVSYPIMHCCREWEFRKKVSRQILCIILHWLIACIVLIWLLYSFCSDHSQFEKRWENFAKEIDIVIVDVVRPSICADLISSGLLHYAFVLLVVLNRWL
jgi:hypothetical protein